MNAIIVKIVKHIITLFRELNGAKFIGIREYTNDHNEVANYVVNANFNYGNAVDKSIEILQTLTDADFQAIELKYKVNNSSGVKYSENKEYHQKYVIDCKPLPKEGTKALESVLKSIKITKTLEQIRNEMIAKMNANKNPETRSNSSQAQIDAYEKITNSIKVHLETGKIHIYALVHSKEVLIEGVYDESNPKLETRQKNAIESYCKNVLNKQLPVTKYRNFVIDESKLCQVNILGEQISLA